MNAITMTEILVLIPILRKHQLTADLYDMAIDFCNYDQSRGSSCMSKDDNLIQDKIKIKDLEKRLDDRGYFAEIMREDWRELLSGQEIKQVSLQMSYPGTIRAWHRHSRNQYDTLIVIDGSMQIAVYDDVSGQLDEVVIGGEKLQAISYPGRLWHGNKTLGNKRSLSIFGNNNLYNYKQPDEERRPWNDPKIIDPRTQEPYDWNKVKNR